MEAWHPACVLPAWALTKDTSYMWVPLAVCWAERGTANIDECTIAVCVCVCVCAHSSSMPFLPSVTPSCRAKSTQRDQEMTRKTSPHTLHLHMVTAAAILSLCGLQALYQRCAIFRVLSARLAFRSLLFLQYWSLSRRGHNLGKRYPGRVTAEFCNTTYNSDLVLRVLYSLAFSLYQKEAGLIWVMLQGCPEY